jgi:hypothetical protein
MNMLYFIIKRAIHPGRIFGFFQCISFDEPVRLKMWAQLPLLCEARDGGHDEWLDGAENNPRRNECRSLVFALAQIN